MNKKGFASIVLVVIVVAVIVIGGYFILSKKSTTLIPSGKLVPPQKILKVAIGLIPKQESPDFYPKVSADGSKIVFMKSGYGVSGPEQSGEQGLWIMNVDGTGIKQLMKDDVIPIYNYFEWSPVINTHYNERYVFAVVKREKGGAIRHGLKVVNETGDYTKELTTIDEDIAFPRWVSINEIAFIDRNDGNKLKIVDISGKRINRNSDEIALVYGEYRDNAGDQGVIKSVTFNGAIKQLTPNNDNGAFPILSPDSKKVVYISFGQGQKIMVMNIDGSNKVQVSSGEHPSWSFDSSRIAYGLAKEDQYNVTTSDIYVVNTDGSENKKIKTEIEKGPALNPRWFPDGKHIVLDYSDKGVGTIEIVPVE